jgi:CHAD domain-containing protein
VPENLLSAEERQALGKLAAGTSDAAIRRRARLLLAYDEGHATLQAALQAGLSRGRARYWKRQFKARGMAVFARDDTSLGEVEPGFESQSSPEDVRRLSQAASEQVGELAQSLEIQPTPLQPEARLSKATELAKFSVAEVAKSPGPGVQPEDPLAEAGRKVWRYLFAHMLLHEAGTLSGENIEELHDMRVATRRMRTAFDVFGAAYTPKAIKSHFKGMRRTGRTLGRVRDLDVFIDKARRYQDSLAEEQRQELEPLLEAWGAEREKARQEMVAYLQGDRYQAFKEKFFAFLSMPGEGARPRSTEPPAPYLVREAVPALVYTRLASVRAFDAILGNATIEQFHALRIEFKKLRYTLEYFREVLGEEAKPVINEIKGLQDHLGDLHDAQVASVLLRDFLERWDSIQAERPVAERRGPEPVLAYLSHQYAERQRLMLSFKDVWARFNRPELREKLAKAVAVL